MIITYKCDKCDKNNDPCIFVQVSRAVPMKKPRCPWAFLGGCYDTEFDTMEVKE